MKRTALPFLLTCVLLLGTACGTSAAPMAPAAATAAPSSSDASGANQVVVTLADNTINSTVTTFKVGVPYTFVIKNTGNHLHNFNIAQPVSLTGSEDASLASALLVVTQDKLPIGGGTTVQYTFPSSAAGTALEFSCLIRRHYELGMRLAIKVTN
jgi:uncharacterized cupredoxin-like copper-binding protein